MQLHKKVQNTNGKILTNFAFKNKNALAISKK